jgi:hypothetical protein
VVFVSVPGADAYEELRQREAAEPTAQAGEYIPRDEAAQAQAAELEAQARKMVTGVLGLAVRSIAPYWMSSEVDDDLRITREKLDDLADAYILVIGRYLPGLIEKFPEVVGAVISTAVVFLPLAREGVPRRKPKPIEPGASNDAADAAGTR